MFREIYNLEAAGSMVLFRSGLPSTRSSSPNNVTLDLGEAAWLVLLHPLISGLPKMTTSTEE